MLPRAPLVLDRYFLSASSQHKCIDGGLGILRRIIPYLVWKMGLGNRDHRLSVRSRATLSHNISQPLQVRSCHWVQ